MKAPIWKSGLVIIALTITYFSMDILGAISFPFEVLPDNPYLRNFLLRLLDYSVLLLVGTILFWKEMPTLLGIHHSLVKSFALALLCVLPMFLIFPFFFELNHGLKATLVFQKAVMPALFEEIAYRALVLGVLFRFCGWSFWPAVLINGIVFGLSHLYQANDLLEAFFTFAVTFIGAVWFGWLYIKRGYYNLYIPIFLYMLMNFSWITFEVSTGAAGNTVDKARLLTILLSIILTIYSENKGLNFSWKIFKVVTTAT